MRHCMISLIYSMDGSDRKIQNARKPGRYLPRRAGISMRGTLDAVTAVVAAAMAEKLIG